MTSPPATRGDDARFFVCGAYLPETRVPARRHAADNKRGPKGTNLEERGDKIIGAPLTPPPSFLPLVRGVRSLPPFHSCAFLIGRLLDRPTPPSGLRRPNLRGRQRGRVRPPRPRGREFVPINVGTGCGGGGGRAACIFLAKKVLISLDLPYK